MGILMLIIEFLGYLTCFLLLLVSILTSFESTVLQIDLTLPAWEVVAVLGFIGMINFFIAIRGTIKVIRKRKKKQEKQALEEKIDALSSLLKETNRLIKMEKEKKSEEQNVSSEGLPFENIDDFIEVIADMVDGQEDLADNEKKEEEITEAPTDQMAEIIPNDRIKKIGEKKESKKTTHMRIEVE